MLEGPIVPAVQAPDLFASWGGFPVHIELSPFVLVVLLVLVGVFMAAISVIFVYHWRRFPFERGLFHWVERVYFLGVLVLLAIAVGGILISS